MSCSLAFYSRIKARIVQWTGRMEARNCQSRDSSVYLINDSLGQVEGNLGRTVSNHSAQMGAEHSFCGFQASAFTPI